MLLAEQHCDVRMQAAEIYNLLRVHEKSKPENALRKAWSLCKSSCKDVIAMAMPLKPVAYSLEGFNKLNSKQQDCITASFYIVYVGRCDCQEFGWSKAPYDNKNKKREEQKPLYTIDSSGETRDQTRFWSFKKVSNNMNKGPRVDDKVDDQDLSFVLKAGTCITVFLREDNYEEQKCMFEGSWGAEHVQGIVAPHSPVLLQLSGTNDEQAAKGFGLKLRRVLPAPQEIINDFCDCFYKSKQELQAVQTEMMELVPLKSVSKSMQGCPMLCKVQENAFVFKDEHSGLLEIIDSGLDESVGKKLLVSEDLVMKSMHSTNINRCLRMLSIAIGHNAVKCVFVHSKAEGTDACTVVHMHVDMAEAFWLNLLHKSKDVDVPTSLPKSSMLTMCFGKPITDSSRKEEEYLFAQASKSMQYLQWYSPSQLLEVATADGREMRCNVVFEMELDMKQSAGQRDVANKLLFMDEVSGFHYVVKVFHAESVVYREENGLVCNNPKLLVTWQLRPGLVASATSVTGTQRKRVYMSADTLDFMNSGEQIPAAVAAAAEEQEETQAELEATDEHHEEQAEPAKKKKRNA